MGYPPPPRIFAIIDLARFRKVILGAQQLAGKILIADELGGGAGIGLTRLSTQAYSAAVDFGSRLRQLRAKKGVGIKRLAPDLGVTYSYLSKLENNEAGPSEEFVERVAQYFKYDRDELLLSAGKVPQEILEILRTHPQDAVEFLRERFGKRRDGRTS